MDAMQHFDKLAICGFRGFSTIELDGLGAFNILLGANDVGKTSILETIFLLTNLSEPKLSVRIQNGRNYLVNEIDDLSSIFHGLDSNQKISITGCSHASHSYRTLEITSPRVEPSMDQKILSNDQLVARNENGKRMDDRSSSVRYGSRVLQYDTEVQYSRQESPLTSSVRLVDKGEKWGVEEGEQRPIDVAYDTKIPARFIGPGAAYDTDRIGKLIVNKKDDILVGYLRKVNPLVQRVTVYENIAFLDVGLAKMIPLNMFGSGMIRTVAILAGCILGDVRVLLIDEIEYGLHHRAIEDLLATLLALTTENGTQVFATTHSIDVVQGLQQVLGQPGFEKHRPSTKCIALQRDKNGVVRPYRYDYRQFEHCISQNIEIR